MPDFGSVDYDHGRDGAGCNGVISDLGGRPEAVWTLDAPDRDGVDTIVRPLAEDAFAALWDGIEASLARRGVFWRHRVVDPTRLLDPGAGHLIVAASERDGRRQRLTFLVPAGEADPTFAAWLDALAVPATALRAVRPGEGLHRPVESEEGAMLRRVLLHGTREAVAEALAEAGYDVTAACTGDEVTGPGHTGLDPALSLRRGVVARLRLSKHEKGGPRGSRQV